MNSENINVVRLQDKFEQIQDFWDPKIIAELNGQHVKIAKVKGEFVAHKHLYEDELFMVIKGQLKMVLENKTLTLNPGELCVIPKNTVHKPVADEEVQLLLFEPISTINTGDITHRLTKKNLENI